VVAPVLAYPYYDPRGQREPALRRELPALRAAFARICVSAIPPLHDEFLHWLEAEGCAVYRNAPGATVGDHARAALRLGLEHATRDGYVFYGFDDRILYALDSEWRTPFLDDMRAEPGADAVVFERTPAAWATHPGNYREIEQMVSRALELMSGRWIELGICALMMSARAAETVLHQSTAAGFEVWGEWVLLALKERLAVTTRAVDWLAWEDPYWENVAPERLKRERESSREETRRRIQMNASCLALLGEERFEGLGGRS
jgi:hypothetical protein